MGNRLQFWKKYFFWTVGIVTVLIFWETNNMGMGIKKEVAINEAKIDFVYVYGDEDSTIYRIILTKNGEKVQIETIGCPLQTELFKNGRWHYRKGNIPTEEANSLFEKLLPSQFNALENFYEWRGTTAHHPALFQIYFRLENNKEFRKEILIEDYPQGVKSLPAPMKKIVEIGTLLQDQTVYASEDLHNDQGKKELSRNIVEIDLMAKGELKYFSTQAVKIIR